MNAQTYLYDGTFDGLLTVVFETFRLKTPANRILPEYEWTETLFDTPITVETRWDWAARVRKGIIDRTSKKTLKTLYRCYHSEQSNIEYIIYKFICKAINSKIDISSNYGDETVLKISQIDKMMSREVHRMHAFIRFQQTKDDIYYAVIEPDFDVLPFSTDHFVKRYPAQTWLIYDSKRHYGMFWDQAKLEPITFAESDHLQLRQLSKSIITEGETDYQELWKTYFKSTNIKERKNMKLHLQHVPRRYWKYLVEKDGMI